MKKHLKLNSKFLPITMILLMLFSTWAEVGLAFSAQAEEHSEKSELEIEKEREQDVEEQATTGPEDSEELKTLLTDLGFEPKLSETTPRKANAPPKISESISKQLQEHNQVDVIIHLKDSTNFQSIYQNVKGKPKAERTKHVMETLQNQAQASQKGLKKALTALEDKGQATVKKELWINNSIVATVDQEAFDSIKERDDIERIQLDETLQVPEITVESTPNLPEWGLEKINATQVWGEYGITGENVVVGIMDTGVDGSHEALKHNYRGKDSNHESSWIDLSGDGYDTPGDGHGHGTHVAGTAVGGGEGEPIGVAPGAEWIAAKIFKDSGSTTTSAIHEAFQWFMAPGGDPANAPHVVNNSWGNSNTYNLEFYDDVQAWISAGIFPLFAAGNDGPGAQTIGSPASFVDSFAVGATDRYDQIASFSSRGPVYWENEDGEMVSHIKPDVSAPGHEIYSAWPDGTYNTISGTSMATPHVAGAIALLLSADQDLNIDEVADVLKNTTRKEAHMGELPNTQYGEGIVNIYQAVTEAAFAGTLEGQLTDESGEPLSGSVHLPDLNITIDVEDGSFTHKIREGEHDIIVKSFGYIDYETTINIEKDQSTEVNWQLEQAESYTVTGQIVNGETDEPVPYAFIRVQDTPLNTIRANESGEFTISNLPTGVYDLQVTGSGILGTTETVDVNQNLNLEISVEPNLESGDQEWRTSNQNFARNALSTNSIDLSKLEKNWSYNTDSKGQIVFASPSASDNTIVYTTDRGWVTALNLQTSNEIWSIRIGDTVRTTPTIDDGVVYLSGGADQNIYALDLATGRTIWTQNIGQPAIYEAPVVRDGTVYVGSSMTEQTTVYALDANTGQPDWSVEFDSSSFFNPTLGEDLLYVGTFDDKTLRALNPEDGSVTWSYQLEENEGFLSHPVYKDGVVYALSSNMGSNGTLHALNSSDGSLLWKTGNVGDSQANTPIVYGDLVVVSSASQPVVKAFNIENGEEVWSNDGTGTILNNGSITSNGVLFVSNTNGSLMAIDVFTGEILKKESLPNYSTSTPLILPGTVLVPHLSGIEQFIAPGTLMGSISDESGQPVEAKISITETGQSVSANQDGGYTFNHSPGQYDVKVSQYGYEQVQESITFVSGYEVNRDFTLKEAETGSVEITVTDDRVGDAIEGVEIELKDTTVSGTTDSNGVFEQSEVYAGTYEMTLSINGYETLSEVITIEPNTDQQYEFSLKPIGIAVLNDYESEITELLNLNGYSSEERDWDIIEDIERYDIVYLNGAYTTDGWKPDEDIFNELVEEAKNAEVNLVFADTWGGSYGSIHHLTDFFGDPQELNHNYGTGSVSLRVNKEHPIFEGYEVGDYLELNSRNGDFAWFNNYSGRDLAEIGSSDLGFVGTGVAYKPVSENSAHLLLSSHAASPWLSPFQGWQQDTQNVFLNSMDYLLSANFGHVTGTVTNEEDNPLDATIEVVETGYLYQDQSEIDFYHDEGTYTLKVRASGYETETLEIEIANGTPSELDIVLTSTQGGSVIGEIQDALSNEPLTDVEVKISQNGELVHDTTSDEQGYYEILDLDEGNYELQFSKAEYINETIDLEIGSVPIEQNMELTPVPAVAVLDDYYASDRSFEAVFAEAGIDVEEVPDNEIMERLDEFDVVFVNGLGLDLRRNLDEFISKADEAKTSLVFGETYYTSSPLNQLVEQRGDPSSRDRADHSSSTEYVVTEQHEIFGEAKVGDTIEILTPGNGRIGYFDGYSGYNIADIKHRDLDEPYGNSFGYKPRTESSVELLLGGYAFTFSHDADDYTPEGKELLIDSVVWAAHAQFPTINGTVTDADGNPLEASINVVGENFETTTNENGEYSIALLEGDYELEINSFGYEAYTVSATADQNSEPLNIEMDVHPDAASISGVVENEQDGQAVEGVNINVEGFPRQDESNTQGAFSVDRMEPGDYKLVLSAEGYVMKEVFVSLDAGEELDLTVDMKPSPLVGIIVDNNSNDETLAKYLEERGFNTTELFYTDLDKLSELDLVIANSDYDRNQEPTEEEFIDFVEALDHEKLSIIWTGHVNGRGGIRFLHEFENNPATELQERDSDKTIKSIAEHVITSGLELDHAYPFESRSNNYYAFDDYDGETVATVNHPSDGHKGDLAAFKGRTTESVEVLLANTTFGYYFSPNDPQYFNETLVQLLNNSILWALDNEEALAADVNGVIENDLGNQIAGTVTVEETGKVVDTNADGEFYLGLQEGTYNLTVEAFGHETGEFSLTVENGEVYNETFNLQSNDIGTLTGQVLDGESEEPISGATVNVLGTPSSVQADENGQFEITLPVGEYDLQIQAEGYMTTTETNIEIQQNETTDVSVFLPHSEKIAVVSMSSRFDEFESVLGEAGYDADYINYTNLEEFIEEIPNYALIIYNNQSYSTSDELFMEFIETTDEHEVSIIFASQYGGGTIGDLSDITGDPEDVNHGYVPGHINIKTLQDHPLFAGISQDEFRILDKGSSNQQYAVYEGYSGTTIGKISHDDEGEIGDGIGYDFRTANSVHLLLSGFEIGSYSDPTSNWTEEASLFYQNALSWAMNASIGEITGTVTDENEEPIANATVSIPGHNIETKTNANGEYQIGIGTGTYDVHAIARGYHEDVQTATVESQGHSVELNFTLEEIEGTSISGQVLDSETEEILQKATVELYYRNEAAPLDTVETGEDGQFAFSQLLPDEYTLSIQRDGYLEQTIEVDLEKDAVELNVLLNNIDVAVIGDHKDQIQTLLNEHDLHSEGRDWNVIDDVENYELIIINASDGTKEQLQDLIDVTDEHGVSLAFLGTWGADNGSIPTLKETVGYPEISASSYNEGEVTLNVEDTEHPIFERLPDEITIHSEKSPYAAFEGYPGHNLGDIEVDGDVKGTGVSYKFNSEQSIHLLLSSFAVNNIVGPNSGWTEDGKALFVQAMEYAMNAQQEEPSIPEWDETKKRTDDKPVTLTGQSDPLTTVNIYEQKGNKTTLIGTGQANEDGEFAIDIEFSNGNYFLYAEAENFAGQSDLSEQMQLIVTGN